MRKTAPARVFKTNTLFSDQYSTAYRLLITSGNKSAYFQPLIFATMRFNPRLCLMVLYFNGLLAADFFL